MDQEKIGRFIAQLRREQGMTQEALGQELLVTNKTVSRWETGAYLPEIVIFSQTNYLFLRHTNNIFPYMIRLFVIFIYSSPKIFRRHFQYFCNEFPSPCKRFLFKIIAKGKTPQHFKKCTVS